MTRAFFKRFAPLVPTVVVRSSFLATLAPGFARLRREAVAAALRPTATPRGRAARATGRSATTPRDASALGPWAGAARPQGTRRRRRARHQPAARPSTEVAEGKTPNAGPDRDDAPVIIRSSALMRTRRRSGTRCGTRRRESRSGEGLRRRARPEARWGRRASGALPRPRGCRPRSRDPAASDARPSKHATTARDSRSSRAYPSRRTRRDST